MSATPISSAATPPQYTPPAPKAPKAPSAIAAATEEATETAAATRQEATHGDQVAIRKLAQQEQATQPPPAASKASGLQGSLDVLA